MPGRPRLESHVYDAAQSLRREALRAMTVVDYATPLPGLLESAAVRSFNPRTSGGAMIAPQAYRILGETMALAEVFPRPLGQLAKPSAPARARRRAVAHPVGIPRLGGDLTRTPQRRLRSTAARRTIASSVLHVRELTSRSRLAGVPRVSLIYGGNAGDRQGAGGSGRRFPTGLPGRRNRGE